MELNSDWRKFHRAAEESFQRGEITRAKELAAQLYESIGLCHREEQDNETTCDAYDTCLDLSFMLDDIFLKVKSFYRCEYAGESELFWLHSAEFVHPGMMWIDVLSRSDTALAKKLKIIRDVRLIIEEYEEYDQFIEEIQICYLILFSQYSNDEDSTEIIRRETLLFDISCGWMQLKKGFYSEVCDACRKMSREHTSDPNQALVMELWANALENLGMVDVAIKKVENAIALADSRHDRTSFEQLLSRLKIMTSPVPENQTKCRHPKSTNRRKTRTIEKRKGYSKNGKVQKSEREEIDLVRCKVTENGREDPVPLLYDESQNGVDRNISSTLADNSLKSWKDVTDFDLPVCKSRKKRRRHKTEVSNLFLNGDQIGMIDRSSQDIFEIKADSVDSEDEFSPLPTELFINFNVDNQPTDLNSDCVENMKEDTYFNQSCEFHSQSPESKFDLIQSFDEKILQNGVELSGKFTRSFTRNKMKFAEYPILCSKDEALKLCSENPQKYKHCKINIETSHRAICVNLDENDKRKYITISGRSKCGKVYSEDQVVVKVYNQNETDCTEARSQNNKTIYGKVVGITKRSRFEKVKNPVFLCTQDHESHLMKPICKTVPKISVLHNNCENKFQVEIYRYDENVKDLKFQDLKWIDPAKRKGYLFLVCLITWNELYPLGAILSVSKSSDSIESSLKLLCLQNSIPSHYKLDTVQQTKTIVQSQLQENKEARENIADKLLVFTIDPPGSKDLDDALSVTCIGKNRYEIGVHIADVASALNKDDPIDIEAQERSRTFYPGGKYRPHHMLPEPLSIDICSLLPNKPRKALSIFFIIDSSGDVKNIENPTVKRTIIRSSYQFTYHEVQKIISNKTSNSEKTLNKDILILHSIVSERRKARLGNKTFAFPIDRDKFENIDSYYSAQDAHNLVEELMILANHAIACHLLKTFPSSVPLRIQQMPSPADVQEWMNDFPIFGQYVLGLQNVQLPDSKVIDVTKVPTKRLKKLFPIQKCVWKQMIQSLRDNNFEQVRHLIGADELHPMQALAFEAWIQFQEPAMYKCSGNQASRKETLHYSLDIKPYTHCTSPIRRYVDIIVQRLVHASLNGDNSPYTTEEVTLLCEKINDVNRREKSFEKECFALHLGKKLSKKPILCNTIIQNVTEKEVSLHFPGMRNLSKDCKNIPFHMLRVCTKPDIKLDRDSKPLAVLSWRQRLYSHTGYSENTRVQTREQNVRIDPHQLAIYQQLPKWQNILKAVMNKNDCHLKETFFGTDYPDMNRNQLIPACVNTETDVSSEVRDGNIYQQCCDFSLSLNHGQILAVQIAAEAKRGVLVPTVQMIEVTRNLKLCIQHVSDPIKCFSRYCTVKVLRQFKSPVEYVKIWLDIFRMESIVKMTQSIPIVINDTPVNFCENSEISDCNIIFHKSFCLKRDIELGCLSEKTVLFGDDTTDDEEKESRYLLSSDCVCIRCDLVNDVPTRVNNETPPSERRIWIGHGEINILQQGKSNSKIKVHIRLHKDSPKPTPDMCVNPPPRCSVELLQKSDPDKRIEAIISCLGKATTLAKAIALGKKTPKLDKERMHAAYRIGADVTICGLAPNNMNQLKAIQQALTSRFSLIQGPPGTGKTYTGIKLVYLFVKINKLLEKNRRLHKQVVFCGPSNKSVDLVARWMQRKFGELSPKTVRMYGSSIENSVYQIPGREYMKKTLCKDNKPDPDLESISLHNLVRQRGKPFSEDLRIYDVKFKKTPRFSNESEINNYKKLLNKAYQDELKHYDVIFCTTAVATSARFLKATQGKICQMIIDEAGMCTEPETLAPIISSKAEQVVLIGDHKQLQPVVLCSEAASLGLDKSLFERYADQAVFLDCQYRMNPRICDFPSKEFYNGKLETMPSIAWKVTEPLSLWRVPTVPHMFCHVEGEEETLQVTTEEGNQQSKSNKAEVEQVIRIYRELVYKEKIYPKHINIMSQYNAQCHAIRQELRKERFTEYNVNTVVASQGGEWDYVIFSTVRSLPEYRIEPNPTLGWCKQNLGFITDQHQINVALTRAKKGLLIIGNKNLMKCDKVWKELLEHYGRQDCVADAELVKSKHPKKKRKHKKTTKKEFY